ncbi:MAG TPA: YbaB/EbfC family nucleoid-associated protein, partial [Actinophytocola sp.]|uniref:YbaB/EbfC family nucleoid-associated protein n=1 Tax=Actinophytocola sp. TaxID=1872138 RepID=UPI002DDCE330
MTVDHRAQVEELLADYQRSREQLAAVHRALASVSASASSEDGAVTATVGPRGSLTGLVIDESAYRRYRPAELADLIVRTAAAAAGQAARSATELVAPVLP